MNRILLILVVIFALPAQSGAETRVTVTGSGSITVGNALNIFGSDSGPYGSSNLFFNAGQKTWNIDGSGWAFDTFNAEVDPAGSTFVYRSPTGATTTSRIPFNNLTIAPTSGSGIFGVDLGCNDFCGLSLKRFALTLKDGFMPDGELVSIKPLVVRVSSPELRSTSYGGSFVVTNPLKIGVFSESSQFVRSDVVRYDPEQGEAVLYFSSEYSSGWRNLFFGFGPDAPESSPYLWANSGYDVDTDGVWYLEEDMGATTTARNAVYDDFGVPTFGSSGTYVGMTSANTIDGVVGRAVLFQGTDDRIDLAQNIIRNLQAFDATPLGVISMWFRTTADGPLFGYQNAVVGGTPSEFVPILYVGTDGKLRGQVWQGTVNPITTTGVVNDGQWHHVALAWGSASQSLYLDGRYVGSLSGTVNHLGMSYNQVGAADFGGGWPSGWLGTRYFNGMIDELKISADEYGDLDAFRQYRIGSERDLVSVSSVNSFDGLHVKGNLTVGGGGGNPTLGFDLAGGDGEGNPEWDVALRVDGNVSINAGASLNLAKQTVIPGEGIDYVYPNVSTFGGDFINNGTADAVNSTVVFSPAGDSVTIGGTSNTSFGTTTINAPGKTVQLKADTSGNFTQFARAIFSGLPGLPLTLQSTSQGSKWNLNLGSLTGSSISHVAIRDGGCHAGTQRFPTNETVINLGNSDDCWGFTVRGTGSTVTGGGGSPQTGGGIFGGGTNIALNMPAVPSSDEGGGNVRSNITDGNESTRWSSAGGYPHSIYVDLGQRYSLNGARIIWEAAYPVNYQIEVSDNASSWTSIASVTGKSSAGTDTFSNLSGTGRYVRILGTTQGPFSNMSLFEFELAGTPAGGGGGAQGGGGSGGGGGAAP